MTVQHSDVFSVSHIIITDPTGKTSSSVWLARYGNVCFSVGSVTEEVCLGWLGRADTSASSLHCLLSSSSHLSTTVPLVLTLG